MGEIVKKNCSFWFSATACSSGRKPAVEAVHLVEFLSNASKDIVQLDGRAQQMLVPVIPLRGPLCILSAGQRLYDTVLPFPQSIPRIANVNQKGEPHDRSGVRRGYNIRKPSAQIDGETAPSPQPAGCRDWRPLLDNRTEDHGRKALPDRARPVPPAARGCH